MLVKDDSCIAEQTIMRYQSNSIAELLGSDWYGILLRHPDGGTTIDTFFDVSNTSNNRILEFAETCISSEFLEAGKSDTFNYDGYYYVYPIRKTQKGYYVFFLFYRKDSPFDERDIRWYKTYAQAAYQRVLLENELVQLREYNDAILESTDYSIVVVDKKYRIVSANLAGKEYFGEDKLNFECFREPQVLIKALGDVFAGSPKQSIPQLWYQDRKRVARYTLFSAAISPLKNSKGVVSAAVIIGANVTSINTQLQTSAQQKYYKDIENIYLSYINDMRTPLMNVMCCADMLKVSANLDDGDKELLKYIIDETDKIEYLNKQMDIFRAINQNDGYSRVDMNSVLANCVTIAGRMKGLKNVKIHFKASNDIPPMSIDGKELYMVLLNVIQMLLDAIDNEGEIEITSCFLQQKQRAQVQLGCRAAKTRLILPISMEMVTSNILQKYNGTLSYSIEGSNEVRYEIDMPVM